MDALNSLRKNILDVAYESQEGHVASSLSVVEILYTLYAKVLSKNDYFILSKGHASLAYYAVLHQFGYITYDQLKTFCKTGTKLGGHPDRMKVPGIIASTGSLGHGLPMAVGIALGLCSQNYQGRVFCLVGDGEMNEGSCWESVLLATHHQLGNLCCTIDYNHSSNRAVNTTRLPSVFSSFGWLVHWVSGHSVADLEKAFLKGYSDVPVVVFAETIKGNSVEFMKKDSHKWHHKSMTTEEYDLAWEGLK